MVMEVVCYMLKSTKKNILSKALVLLLAFVSFSCSNSIINSRQISDFKSLETKVIKRNTMLSNSVLRIKFKASIDNGENMNKFSGRIIVYSDTSLRFSIMSPTLGVEVAQCYFNLDSILFINKYNKEYITSSYSDFKQITNLNFKFFYSIFTCSYLNFDSVSFSSNNTHYLNDFKKFIVNDSYKTERYNFFISSQFDSYGHLEKTDYKSYSGNYFKTNYSNFTNNFCFPSEIVLSTMRGNEKIEVKLIYENVVEVSGSENKYVKPSLSNYKRIGL